MDYLVASIQNLSSSDAELFQLQQQLKDTEKSFTAQQVTNALQTLDPAVHSLGVLFLLDVQSKTLPNQGDAGFLRYVSTFLQVCNAAQIRLTPESFCNVCRKFKEQAIALNDPRAAVVPLRSAVRKLQISSEYLTPIHADFFCACLKSKHYNAATEVVNEDVFCVDPSKTALVPTDFLLYCYYGGMICIGRKRYARAMDLFLMALTAPTLVGSAIAVAIYKKHILTCLLHTGQGPSLPKFTASKMKQVVEAESKPYQDLAQAYTANNFQQLQSTWEQHQTIFIQDNNAGLVKLVMGSFKKRNIQRLTSVYLTLSLDDIAKVVGLANAAAAELYILRLIEAGDVHAHISPKDGMVRFLEDPEQYDNAAMAAKIADAVDRSMQLANKMQEVHNAVTCDKSYLQKTSGKEKARFDHGGEEFGLGSMLYPQP